MMSRENPPQYNIYRFAVHVWEAYRLSKKRAAGPDYTVHWPANKLEHLYSDFFGEPLDPNGGGLERLLDKVPIFEVNKAGDLSVSKEKLLTFLVFPAVRGGCVDQRRFCENFVTRTTLDVGCVYKLLNKYTFTEFSRCLSSSCPLFRTIPDSAGGFLLTTTQNQLYTDPTDNSIYAPSAQPNRLDTSYRYHQAFSFELFAGGKSSPDLELPPHKLHCIQSDALAGLSVPLAFPRPSTAFFPSIAGQQPTKGKGKRRSKKKKKKQNMEQSLEVPERPLPDFIPLETDFPSHKAQPPYRPGRANLHGQSPPRPPLLHAPAPPMLHVATPFMPQVPLLESPVLRSPTDMRCHYTPPRSSPPVCLPPQVIPPTEQQAFLSSTPKVPLLESLVLRRPTDTRRHYTPPRSSPPVCLPPQVIPPTEQQAFLSSTPKVPLLESLVLRSPTDMRRHYTPPRSSPPVCLPPQVIPPTEQQAFLSSTPKVPLLESLVLRSPTDMRRHYTPPRSSPPVCLPPQVIPPTEQQAFLSSTPKVPLLESLVLRSPTDTRRHYTPPRSSPPVCLPPRVIPPTEQLACLPSTPQVFPNPDTPDELVAPAHPHFHPEMTSASSSLSTYLTFTDVRGRPDTPKAAAKKINARLNAIIDDLASTGKFVPEHVVKDFKEKLLKQSYRARCSVNSRDIQVFDDFCKIHGRISQLIQIFCWMSPITTLYELERALVSSEKVSSFQELRMGPLIKHPLVAKFFQPSTYLQEIPEITAHQIQKMLMKFLDKTRKTTSKGEKHSVKDFLEFFAKILSKSSPLDLCVRITSFPLAIQTNFRFRRLQRESRDRVQQKVEEEMSTIVRHEMDQVRRKLATICDSRSNMVATKNPVTLLTDIFTVFHTYLAGYQSAKVNAFLQLLWKQERVQQMFLLAIYVGAYGVERREEEGRGMGGVTREENRDVHQAMMQPVILHRTHGEVLDILLQLLKRQPFPVSLSSLVDVEKAVASHFDAPSFHPLTSTSFLDFVVSDAQCTASLGGALSIGATASDSGKKRKVVKIVSQLRHTERSDKDIVSETLKLQCGVPAVDKLNCGSIEKLIADVAVQERAEVTESACRGVTYVAPLLMNGGSISDSHKLWSGPNLGVLGHRSVSDAVACLKCAPLLEDLSQWSHWDLVFKPEHGELADFIERERPQHGLHALEITPGILLRVDPDASHQKFLQAVEAYDPINTAGQLVSIVVQQGSVHEMSSQLLGNHVQTALDKLVSGPAQPSCGGDDHTQLAMQFIYHCLIRIPHQISHFISKEVFLEPLRKVSSMTAVEDLHRQCQGNEGERRRLQALGMGLGIKAWNDDFFAMLKEAENSQVEPKPKPPTSAHTTVKANDGGRLMTTCDDKGRAVANSATPATASAPTVSLEDMMVLEDKVHNQIANVPVSASITVDPETDAQCRSIVESIRSEEFGIGLELDGREKQIAERQRQREGRGLQRLSKELYSKDSHFVLELIQNADDNSYHESLFLSDGSGGVPALKFIIDPTSVSVLNNEVGFNEKNVRAICDVGRSTKGAHQSGYIGQKGIGFKSVFRVTDTPEIHSGGYHIRFDAHCDAVGYILPHWIEEGNRESAAVGKGWNTTIILPLKEDQISMSLVRKFQDVRPSLLLFLHRLRGITVEHQVSGVTRCMTRSDGAEGIIQIEHNTDGDTTEQDTWLLVRKQLTNASQFKAEVEVTEVALAFPVGTGTQTVILAKDLQQQQVFAFLPLRSYGFRFIAQGDFDLPSSREDVNSDSVWNQFIRDEIPQLFLSALDKIMKLPGLSVTNAVGLYLQFVPLDGELHDFFKPVAIRIRNLLRGTACLPTEPGSDEISEPFVIVQALSETESEETSSFPHLWKQPSELVTVRDAYIRKHIPQSLLNSTLHYFYLNSELTQYLNPPLQSHLGIQTLTVDHLIAVAEAVVKSYSGASHSVIMLSDDSDEDYTVEISDGEESDGAGQRQRNRTKADRPSPHSVFVQWVAQWLACVHIVLEEEGDRSPVTIGKLKKAKIIPLTNGVRFAAQDGSLFFPSDGDSVSTANFKGLYDEIMVVDPLLFEIRGNPDVTAMIKPSHRVHSILELLGVREMYPAEVIKHHILPCFKSNQWKTKSPALLTTYLVYIKDSIGKQGSGITEVEIVSLLRDCVALATKKHGAKQPAKDVLHFSSQFQPSYDLEKLFPDASWKLVSPGYLKNFTLRSAVSSWHSFLSKLGVRNVLAIRKFNESVSKGNDRWQELRKFVGRSPDGSYTLRDYTCSEFEDIVRSVEAKKHRSHQQMLELVRLLDTLWDEEYRQFAFAKCYDGSNEHYIGGDKSVPSSFHRALKDRAWLPAVAFPSGEPYSETPQLYRGRDLFDNSRANQRLLDCHVPYVVPELKNSKLLELLQIKCRITAEELVGFLRMWSKACAVLGSAFKASIDHMSEVYVFLSRQMIQEESDSESIKEIFVSGDEGLIFVPDVCDGNVSSAEHVKGQFYSIHDVCWVDPSTVLYTQQKHNRNLPPELPKVLQLYYWASDPQRNQNMKEAFERFGIRGTPTAAAYVNTLQFISTLEAIPEKHHISDFCSVALQLSRVCMNGDITPQYIRQQLKGSKIFPSHRDLWVPLDSCLLENDDLQLAKVFRECNAVHFLQWPAALQKKQPRHMHYHEQLKEDERKHFIDACGISKLSEVVETMVVPKGMVMPLESLRKRLHVMVPLIQKYLITNEENLYQSLLQENLKEKLANMFIASVLGLECLYSIQHHGMTYTSPSVSSPGSEYRDSAEEDTAALYVVASKVDSPKCLVPSLVKIFISKQTNFTDSVLFENLIKDMLLSPVQEIEDSVLSDRNYSFGEVDENDAWVVTSFEEPEPTASDMEVDERCASASDAVEDKGKQYSSESDGLKSWPPMAPVSANESTQHPAKPPPPGSAVADVVGDDDIQMISKKYAMSSKGAVSRHSKQLPEQSSRDVDSKQRQKYNQGDESTTPDREHSTGTRGATSERGGRGTGREDQQLQDEDKEKQHKETQRPRFGEDREQQKKRDIESREDSISNDGHGPPTDGKNSAVRKDRGWHEAMKPDAALTLGSFSIASALQSVSFESCDQLLNQSFLEDCSDDQVSRERVGRWGEEYVYKYFNAIKHLPNGQAIQSVTWINKTHETGEPYDIEVNIEPDKVLYIEVKSTKSPRKELMQFSWNELQFADRKKQCYHLYRVYSAGSARVALKWMENLSDVLDTRPVRLLLEL